jgi:pyruvate dehydrogenase E2 component (dihydrolipoamide acetyltransferase)
MMDYRMPALGADMEAGTLVEWLVKPGDKVKSGSIIAVVETQKGAIEIEVFHEGTIAEISVPVGRRVPVGTILAHIDDGTPPSPLPPVQVEISAPVGKTAKSTGETTGPPVPPRPSLGLIAAGGARLKITPVARRRAAALGVDPRNVAGSGIEGSIRLADVERLARSVPERPRHVAGYDAAAMRAAIAAAMSRSKREIPHYYLTETIDLGRALAWLESDNSTKSPQDRLLPAALLLKASALALRKTPRLNGLFLDGEFKPGEGIHIGWAVSLRGGGLIAPAIRDADRKSLSEIMSALRDVVERARKGSLRSSELGSATVTVTSLGDRGAEAVTAIIHPPQVAIIGFGRIVTRPWVVDGRIEARSVVATTLAGDHRVTDGHAGGLFLTNIRDLLQEPDKL